MPNKIFLETFPLYKTFKTDIEFFPQYEHTYLEWIKVPKPAIHMSCKQCGSDQTFNMVGEYWGEESRNAHDKVYNEINEIRYLCSACKKGLRIFLVRFSYTIPNKDKKSVATLEKVGQYPAWSIEIDKELEKILGSKAELLKKGLINESQSYGIGAFGYYRRIVEEVIDELLDMVEALVEPSEKKAYKVALEKTKKTRIAQEKIDLVKDMLPQSLKPDNINPLGVIHSALSEGLHSLSDEECIKQAEIIRGSLTFLVNQVIKTKNESKSFTDGMRKLLRKKL